MTHLREDGLNRVVLLSDGVANVGQTDPRLLADQIAQKAGRNTQLAVVGVGRQTYNEVILEQFANNGNGTGNWTTTSCATTPSTAARSVPATTSQPCTRSACTGRCC